MGPHSLSDIMPWRHKILHVVDECTLTVRRFRAVVQKKDYSTV